MNTANLHTSSPVVKLKTYDDEFGATEKEFSIEDLVNAKVQGNKILFGDSSMIELFKLSSLNIETTVSTAESDMADKFGV